MRTTIKMTRKILHKAEMELVRLCDDKDIEFYDMREIIINKFTDLMNLCEK